MKRIIPIFFLVWASLGFATNLKVKSIEMLNVIRQNDSNYSLNSILDIDLRLSGKRKIFAEIRLANLRETGGYTTNASVSTNDNLSLYIREAEIGIGSIFHFIDIKLFVGQESFYGYNSIDSGSEMVGFGGIEEFYDDIIIYKGWHIVYGNGIKVTGNFDKVGIKTSISLYQDKWIYKIIDKTNKYLRDPNVIDIVFNYRVDYLELSFYYSYFPTLRKLGMDLKIFSDSFSLLFIAGVPYFQRSLTIDDIYAVFEEKLFTNHFMQRFYVFSPSTYYNGFDASSLIDYDLRIGMGFYYLLKPNYFGIDIRYRSKSFKDDIVMSIGPDMRLVFEGIIFDIKVDYKLLTSSQDKITGYIYAKTSF